MVTPKGSVPGVVLTWESQAEQYAFRDTPGISLERRSLGNFGNLVVIDCLLYRDDKGLLVGILNHYNDDSLHERGGNINLYVKPEKWRQGIGTALLLDAMKRWDVDLEAQNYTFAGAIFVGELSKKGVLPQ